MENGCPSLADQLATSQQRVRELEQTDAEQKAVIVQQQEAIAAYQEQLAKAAEQLRFLKRAMFGQRRERYAPPPDQKVLFVPEVVEGLDAKQETTQDSNADSPAASGSTKATTTQGSSYRNSGNIGRSTIRYRTRNCLAAVAGRNGLLSVPSSRSGWRWKRTCSMTSGPAAAVTGRGGSWPIIGVIFKRTATSSTARRARGGGPPRGPGVLGSRSARLRGSDSGDQPSLGP